MIVTLDQRKYVILLGRLHPTLLYEHTPVFARFARHLRQGHVSRVQNAVANHTWLNTVELLPCDKTTKAAGAGDRQCLSNSMAIRIQAASTKKARHERAIVSCRIYQNNLFPVRRFSVSCLFYVFNLALLVYSHSDFLAGKHGNTRARERPMLSRTHVHILPSSVFAITNQSFYRFTTANRFAVFEVFIPVVEE